MLNIVDSFDQEEARCSLTYRKLESFPSKEVVDSSLDSNMAKFIPKHSVIENSIKEVAILAIFLCNLSNLVAPNVDSGSDYGSQDEEV